MTGLLGDLHEFDLAEYRWRDRAAELQGEAPTGREGHGMATTGGRVYIFGGWHGEGWLSASKQTAHLLSRIFATRIEEESNLIVIQDMLRQKYHLRHLAGSDGHHHSSSSTLNRSGRITNLSFDCDT